MNTKRALIGILLGILFAVSLIFSFDYIAANADHDCTGEECGICAILQTAEEVCGSAKKTATAAITVGLLYAICLLLSKETTSEPAETTPVSRCDILTN